MKCDQSSEGVAQFVSTLAVDAEVPYIAAEEATGALVKALVLEEAGKNLIAYNEILTPREMSKAFSEATGLKAEAVQLPKGESHVPLPDGIQRQMDETWAYYKEFGYEGRDDPTVIHPHQVSLHTSFALHFMCGKTEHMAKRSISISVGKPTCFANCRSVVLQTRMDHYSRKLVGSMYPNCERMRSDFVGPMSEEYTSRS
jgi:hypothetical protein